MKKLKYNSFCSICGLPINKMQIGAVIDDLVLLDFNDRCYVEFSAHICSECWEKIKQHNIGGMEKAMERRRELKKLQKGIL